MVPSDWCDAAAAGGCGHSRESPSPRSLGHGRGAPEATEGGQAQRCPQERVQQGVWPSCCPKGSLRATAFCGDPVKCPACSNQEGKSPRCSSSHILQQNAMWGPSVFLMLVLSQALGCTRSFFAYFQAWVCLLKCCSNKCFNCFMSYVDNDLEVIKAWGWVGATAVWELTGHQEVAEQGAGRWLSELFQGKRGLQVGERLQAGLANPL